MESSKVGYWLQVGANIGILGGLILVGLQMQQNSELLSAQLSHQESDRYIAIETAAMGDDLPGAWAKVLEDPTALTLEDQVTVEGYIFSTVERWRSLHRLSNLGLLSQNWEPIIREDATYYLGHPYGQSWWKNFTSDPTVSFPQEVVTVVDNALETMGTYDSVSYFEGILKGVKEFQSPRQADE